MKKCLLIDADSKYSNLALMKISTYVKSKGYTVDLIKANISYYPSKQKEVIVDAKDYDQVYVSIIFSNTIKYLKIINNDNIIIGGVGFDIHSTLFEEIEALEPDYSIYSENDYSIGFITRGCIRSCYFCVVQEKEGWIRQVNTLDQIIRHKKVKFLDNNILAFKDHELILKELVERKIKCEFNQGLDIRLITESNAELISKLNYTGEYIFAFDDIKLKSIVEEKLIILKKYIKADWRIKFYIYCSKNMNIQDTVFRIDWCKRNKVLPYVMRDLNCWDSENKNLYTDLASWANQPNIFKKMNFRQFCDKRDPNNLERYNKSFKLAYSDLDKR